MKYWILICCFLLNLNLSSQDKVAVCDMDMMVDSLFGQLKERNLSFSNYNNTLDSLSDVSVEFIQVQYNCVMKFYNGGCASPLQIEQMVLYLTNLETDVEIINQEIEYLKNSIENDEYEQIRKAIQVSMQYFIRESDYDLVVDVESILYKKMNTTDITREILNNIQLDHMRLDPLPFQKQIKDVENRINELKTYSESLQVH